MKRIKKFRDVDSSRDTLTLRFSDEQEWEPNKQIIKYSNGMYRLKKYFCLVG